MKHKTAYPFLVLGALIGLNSCEKTLEFTDEEVHPFLVVNCRLIPGEVVEVELTRTLHILDESDYFAPVKNARLTISNGLQESLDFEYVGSYDSTMIYDPKTRTYLYEKLEKGVYRNPSFPVEAGKTYTLIAEADGMESIRAETSIPESPEITRIDTLSERFHDDYSTWIERKAKITFSDPASSRNYYDLKVIRAQMFISFDPYSPEPFVSYSLNNNNIDSDDPVFNRDESDILGDLFSSSLNLTLFDDALINGKTYTLSFTFDRDFIPSYDEKNYNGGEFPVSQTYVFNVYKIQLNALDEAFFQYSLTSMAQKFRGSDFFSEPVLVYTNIKNGAGFMGSYIQNASYLISHNFTEEMLALLPEGDAESLFLYINEEAKKEQYPYYNYEYYEY
ncbi:MAG TPA: DUF4249 domain-containing protein [Prolixibacteraceae bacterium]|nr:DUF4249 domain-containing protein [Prolixibacteraceae bacterium]